MRYAVAYKPRERSTAPLGSNLRNRTRAALADAIPTTICKECAGLDAERWVPVLLSGYGQHYEISSFGRIRRLTGPTQGLVLRRRINSQWAYDYCALSANGERKEAKVHRVMAMSFIGLPPSPSHHVAHWDGRSLHNHLSNLRWATPLENASDQFRNGAVAAAKLTADQVRNIRVLHRERGMSHAAISRLIGISRPAVSAILEGKSWTAIS